MTTPQTDLEEIRRLFAALGIAWERGDGGAYAAHCTDDVDYVLFDGTRLRGRAENAVEHQRLFDTILQGSRLQGEIESIAFLGPDAAVVHSVGAVVWPWQKAPSKKARSRQTTLVVRQGDRWLARAFQNTRVQPFPRVEPGSFGVRLFRLWVALRLRLASGGRGPSQAGVRGAAPIGKTTSAAGAAAAGGAPGRR
jgi:uncharacterized protein (TIGR02246 family)